MNRGLTQVKLSDMSQDIDKERSEMPDDLTGRDRMVGNVLASWVGHSVFIVAGFIMPRMIDRRLGQELLGVWDFAWSVVAYFSLVQAGIVSSTNRYVAKHRASHDIDGINRSVSSVTCVLFVMASVIALLALGISLLLPAILSDRLGAHSVDVRYVVLLLGVALAVQVVASGFGGVVTGHHRWGIHNAIHAGGHTLTVAAMVVVLCTGGGLIGLAVANLVGQIVAQATRCVVAHFVCPGLRVRLCHANWQTARRMLHFGGKTFMPRMGQLFVNQTVVITLAWFLGPAILAIYARPRSLIRHIRTLVAKFACVLTPTASSMQVAHRSKDLRDFFIASNRSAIFLVLPLVLLLAILGGPLLHLWMGPRYANDTLVAVLAVGYLACLTQLATMSILAGLNAHGRPGLVILFGHILSLVLVFITLGFLAGGLTEAAIAVVIPSTLVNAVYVPLYACRLLKISVREYFSLAIRTPLLCVIPFGMCLFISRLAFPDRPFVALACGGTVGLTCLFVLYWKYALTPSLKERVLKRLGLIKCSRLIGA